MAQLPIQSHALKYRPGAAPSGADAYRRHMHLEENGAAVDYLVVDLSGPQAVVTGLSAEELDAGVEAAVQRLASGRLDNERPVVERIADWDAPVVHRAEHFG